LLDRGVKCVIITMGAQGALVASREKTFFAPATRIEAVDTTAAGDAFSGALACGLASRLSLEDSVRQASLAGALAATRLGAQPSLPTAEELRRFADGR
jgi:ribokinase